MAKGFSTLHLTPCQKNLTLFLHVCKTSSYTALLLYFSTAESLQASILTEGQINVETLITLIELELPLGVGEHV